MASLPHVKLAPMSAPGPTGERQAHLDAVVACAGAGLKRRLFGILDVLTVQWATGDIPEDCRFLLNTQLMFLKKEKDPTTNIFGDGGWTRSLTEAQEQISQNSASRMTQVTLILKKSDLSRWREFLRKKSLGDSWRSVKEKSQPSQQQFDNSVLAPREELRPSPPSTGSSLTKGRQEGHAASPNQRGRKKLFWAYRMGRGAKFSKFLSPKNMKQWQDGNTEPCPVWNKEESNRRSRIVAQSKEMALWSGV